MSQSDKSEHDGSSPLERSSTLSFIFKSVKFPSECHYWDWWSLLWLAASLWISRVLTIKYALKTTDSSSVNLNKGSMGFTGKVWLCWISWCLVSTRLKNKCKLLWQLQELWHLWQRSLLDEGGFSLEFLSKQKACREITYWKDRIKPVAYKYLDWYYETEKVLYPHALIN